MDFILPSEDTMELMREEFSKMKTDSFARAFAFANNGDTPTNADNETNTTHNSLNETVGNSKSGEARDAREVRETHNRLGENVSNSKSGEAREVRRGEYIEQSVASTLLLLYFVKHLGYNISYGTQIFNTQRGMEPIRCVESHFGQLNDLH